MENNILFHKECDFQINKAESISNWLAQTAENENKLIGNINYIFCDDQYLLKKNKDYLKHDTLTDIITFDYSKEDTLSGDIFISVERVKENAVIFAQPFQEELKRVMVHGLLHLLAYKDKTEDEAKIMRKKENFYLSKF